MADLRRFGVLPLRVLPGRLNIVIWALALLLSVAQLSVAAPLAVGAYGISVHVALLLAVLQAAAIPLGLVAPVWATVLAVISATSLAELGSPESAAPWPMSAPTIVAYAIVWTAVGLRSRWWVPVGGWLFSVLTAVIVAADYGGRAPVGTMIADLVVFASVTLVAVGLGIVARNWSEVRAQLSAERAATAAELARREAVEEKARIARELHDVVAHGMSAIQVRAASARYRMPGLPEEAAAEFDELAATARSSMAEMRTILGLLRDDGQAEHTPQPGLEDIPALLERARTLGPVEEAGSWPDDVVGRGDALLGLTAYRVVQEALSNVARHAAGAATRIEWADGGTRLLLTVRNGPAAGTDGPPVRADRGGHGLRGMEERLGAIGGAMHAAPTQDGGFEVRAVIPREERS